MNRVSLRGARNSIRRRWRDGTHVEESKVNLAVGVAWRRNKMAGTAFNETPAMDVTRHDDWRWAERITGCR